jgi:hypothetical protein
LDDAIGLLSAMNSNLKAIFCFGIMQIIEKLIAIIVISCKIIAKKPNSFGASDGNGSFPDVP